MLVSFVSEFIEEIEHCGIYEIVQQAPAPPGGP
jgi:hypothetical protein